MIDAALIRSTQPCRSWRESGRIEGALEALHHPASWSVGVERAAADGWRTVSRADLRLTMCRYAARRHRAVLVAWVVPLTHRSVARQRARWPEAPATVLEIWDRLERWGGDRAEIEEIRLDTADTADDLGVYTYSITHTTYAATTYMYDDAAIAAVYAATSTYIVTDVTDVALQDLRDLARRLDEAMGVAS